MTSLIPSPLMSLLRAAVRSPQRPRSALDVEGALVAEGGGTLAGGWAAAGAAAPPIDPTSGLSTVRRAAPANFRRRRGLPIPALPLGGAAPSILEVQ